MNGLYYDQPLLEIVHLNLRLQLVTAQDVKGG